MTTGQLNPILHYLHRMGTAHPDPAETDAHLLERFACRGDEAAFTALLRRHGPLVLGVCRRVLRDAHEAEDAFQATFLLLVRKAGSLRRPEALGPWLYGVAYRTALRARGRAARRLPLPGAETLAAPPTADEVLWHDIRPVLDDAIERLPAKYRTPFVLCYLEGMTQAQAARHLGCPPGTVATRLSRARQRLRVRLARHGFGTGIGLLTAGLAARAAPAVPPSLLTSTARAALALAAGPAAAGAIAPAAATLMKGVCKAMLMDKVRTVILALVALGAVGGAGVLTYRALAAEPGRVAEQPAPAYPPPRAEDVPPSQPAAAVPAPAGDVADPGATARTPNFLVTAPSRRCARLIAEAAEQQRRSQARRWLGHELPDWPEPCRVKVAVLPDHVGSGIPSKSDGSFTTFHFEKGTVVDQEMRLEASLEQILARFLPHEVTHTVFASSAGVPMPRWADEGGAMLAEDAEEQQRYELSVGEICGRPGRMLPLRRLLPMQDYPDRDQIAAFYAESYSLTRFLVERKDGPTFLAFVKQGMRDGWDEAAHAHYRFRDVDALEETWRAGLPHPAVAPSADDPTQPAAGSSARLPSGPPPTMGLARITPQNHLRVRVPEIVSVPMTAYPDEHFKPYTFYQINATERVETHPASEAQAFDSDGHRISPKDLARLLREERPVLLSANGKKVDPFYLGFMKEGTLVLVLPPRIAMPSPPAAPPPPTAPGGN